MASKPPIQQLSERLLVARGIDYQNANYGLQAYLHDVSDEQFEAEIERVTNAKIFGKLWSMGLNARRQQACVARATELEGKAE